MVSFEAQHLLRRVNLEALTQIKVISIILLSVSAVITAADSCNDVNQLYM